MSEIRSDIVLDGKLEPIFTGTKDEVLKWLWKNYPKNKKIVWVSPRSPRRRVPAYAYMHSDVRAKVKILNGIKLENVRGSKDSQMLLLDRDTEGDLRELFQDAVLHYLDSGWAVKDGGGCYESFLRFWGDLNKRDRQRYVEDLLRGTV